MDTKTEKLLWAIRNALRLMLGALEDYMADCGMQITRSWEKRIR